MKIIGRDYIENSKEEILSAITNGKIFIYPTDTIYGIGCNAELGQSVQKIREIKNRDEKPFSVIAPGKKWILNNCDTNSSDVDQYLPGPYTLIVDRTKDAVSQSVNPVDRTLGVRIPDHWFAKLVQQAGVPFVTTSVNVSGEPHMEKLEDLKKEILEQVDYVVYEGEKRGKRSEKVVLTNSTS